MPSDMPSWVLALRGLRACGGEGLELVNAEGKDHAGNTRKINKKIKCVKLKLSNKKH